MSEIPTSARSRAGLSAIIAAVTMDWNDVRYFLALARLKSIRSAGASLGVSHSTVARRVEALEEQLSTRLFDRSRDGYTLTDAGQRVLPSAERIETEMAQLERGVVGSDERLAGPVSLTCCDNFVAALVLPALAEFCATYPGIELTLTTDSRSFDLAKREADIAIRTLARGGQPPEYLIGHKLAPVVVCSYVAPEHEARLDPACGAVESRWVSFDERSTHEKMIAASSYAELSAWGSFSCLELLVEAAKEGLGLVMLPTYVGDRDPGLRRLSKPDLRHLADLWLLTHPDLRDNARLKGVRSCAAAGLRAHASLFAGEGWCSGAPR